MDLFNGKTERYVVLGPRPSSGEEDWPEGRWSELVEWLDAQGIAVVLLAHEVYVQEPGAENLRLVTKDVEMEQVREIVSGAEVVVVVGGMVAEVATAVGADVLKLEQPTWNIPVAAIIDGLSPKLDIDTPAEPSISVCLMVRNEMKLLPKTIELARRCGDQIVVVDTKSTDGTREWLAQQNDVLVLDFDAGELIQSFGAVRNSGIDAATGKYVLWLDAPDRLKDPENLRQAILAQTSDVYMLTTTYAWGGHFRRENVVLRPFAFFQDRVHEFIQVGGLKTELLPDSLGAVRERSVKVNRESSFARNTRLLQAMLDESPADHPRRGRWLFYMGIEYFQEGKFGQALPWLYKRLEFGGWEDETFGALVALGQIQLYYKADFGEARKVASLLGSMEPTCREWAYMMAEADRLEGNRAKAIEMYQMTKRMELQHPLTWAWSDAYGPKVDEHLAALIGKTGS
jgi:glycosyltransferase involved in cell wall biosynthesis